jgi:hypothetical protein
MVDLFKMSENLFCFFLFLFTQHSLSIFRLKNNISSCFLGLWSVKKNLFLQYTKIPFISIDVSQNLFPFSEPLNLNIKT